MARLSAVAALRTLAKIRPASPASGRSSTLVSDGATKVLRAVQLDGLGLALAPFQRLNERVG